MKAKTVSESIEFQRGKDPKAALGIGLSDLLLSNREYDIYDEMLGDVISSGLRLPKDKILFIWDSRGPEDFDELVDYIYNSEKIYSEEVLNTDPDHEDNWLGNVEVYDIEEGKIAVVEGIDHLEIWAGIETFNNLDIRSKAK